ncbi:MAG: zinc ribbon domain-containing protein [Acidobacteriota bacterium]
MSTGTGAYAEHHFRKVIPGNIETVRQRLSDVLEDFNYIVISDNPLQAKRPEQKNMWIANILEYDARLTIALKAISPASTLATFDYEVAYIFNKGDMLALEREADAIIALATAPINKTICPACETENLGAVRFCRACGTPIALTKLPAELEVMRLTAGLSASQIEIVMGLLFVFLTLLVALPLIFLGSLKALAVGWILFGAGELLGAVILAYGLRRLHKTINQTIPQEIQPGLQRVTQMQEPVVLPPPPDQLALAPQPPSVTEGTTELINQPEKTPVALKQAKNTDAMDS